MIIEPIAHIYNDLPEKFGVPRQSGLVPELKGTVVFCPAYRNVEALRGLEEFSHIWLLWDFSLCHETSDGKDNVAGWQPTVRPPRLGGNVRMGVFATRSPFRPNHIGLSCVKVEGIELDTPQGPVIHVSGADLMNGTPIYDIKPYIRFTDSHPEAISGFVDTVEKPVLKVHFPENLLAVIPSDKQSAVLHLLSQDPRPAYHNDADKVYGLSFDTYNIHFRVRNSELEVVDVTVKC